MWVFRQVIDELCSALAPAGIEKVQKERENWKVYGKNTERNEHNSKEKDRRGEGPMVSRF